MVLTEAELMKKHPRLCEQLYTFRLSGAGHADQVEYVKRTFVVNRDVPVSHIRNPYTHIKTPQAISY